VNQALAGPFDYSVFGLHLRSELHLPELLAADPRSPQVVVRLGKLPHSTAAQPGLQPMQDGALLTVPNVARYAITDGSRITVDREPDVPDANVRLYLLGSAMGILLHQRGLLPLHANAVEIGDRAFAFMGPSGAGKSTLAAMFNDRGFRIVADDVCVVDFCESGQARVCPGVGRLRLWREALDATGRDVAVYQRSFSGADAPDKYDVPLIRSFESDDALGLAAVYLLERGESFIIDQLTGLAAVEAVFANTYRGAYVPLVGSSHDHWSACIRLVRNTPVFRAWRPWDLGDLAGQFAGLFEHAEQVPRP
jgi:hypothetical protein